MPSEMTRGADPREERTRAVVSSEQTADDVVGETRWPMAGAVLAAIVLTILFPDAVRVGPTWLLPIVEGLLLVILIVGDPGRISRRSRQLRAISIVLVSVLVLATLWSTGQLIDDLISGGPETNSASDLLASGTAVWFANIIAFALLYWEMDGGGAAARAHNPAGEC
jgi:hypothetical protein